MHFSVDLSSTDAALSRPTVCMDYRLVILGLVITARSELRKVLFLALARQSVSFLFVYEISREPLNGFAPNSHGRRVWSLAWTSLKVKVKG